MTVNKSKPLTSIIIPTLNEENYLPKTLAALHQIPGHSEILIVDGGSSDKTADSALPFRKVQFIQTKQPGRAHQLNVGAQYSKGDFLFFLHADTIPAKESLLLIEATFRNLEVTGGSFRLNFDQNQWYYQLLSKMTTINSPFWTFGDQGIFVRREAFFQVGGYADYPILEDLDLQRKLRKTGQFVKLDYAVKTSARRYQKNKMLVELGIDTLIVGGYYLGICPKQLKKWYQLKARKIR